LIREDIQSGRLVRVPPQWSTKDLPVHLVYSSHRALPTRVRVFLDFAYSYLTNELR
jgi:DNA-binding transcriptional LysR family regulator